jgi:phospholipase/lecithinase/hemolysin
MKLRLVTLNGLLLLTLSVITAPVWALSFNQIFIFGDSFSDTGNNAVLFDKFLGGARTDVPVPSQDFIPTAPYRTTQLTPGATTDRYSNGPVWAEQFAAKFGLSATASLLGGTDYAYGGARTGPLGATLPSTPSLLDQVAQFRSRGNVSPDALYILAGGGNDARDAFAAAASGNDNAAKKIISDYVNNIRLLITTLAGAGATNIVVWDVPDIGLAPAIASNSATELVEQMNAGLDGVLQELQAAVPHLIEFDIFGLIQDIVNHPTQFDLSNVTTPCATLQKCIDNPDGYLFWDGVHLTTAGYSIVADAMLQAVPEPATLILVVLGLIGFVVVRRTADSLRKHPG